MTGRIFLFLEPAKVASAFEPHQFGEQVDISFPSIAWDIEEAARCLAFDRWTAAVFHLSRVAEIATVTISKRVGYKDFKEGFSAALKYLDCELKRAREDYKNADSRIKGDRAFLSSVSAQMRAVNNAW